MNDLINALFEAFGLLAVFFSVFKVLQDKEVKGVSVITLTFFTCWGAWNMHYYPSMHQPISAIFAAATFLMNFVWLTLCLYYRK